MDNIILSFYETLAHLEVGYNKKQFSINKSKNNQELQLFIRMELWQKEEVGKSSITCIIYEYSSQQKYYLSVEN